MKKMHQTYRMHETIQLKYIQLRATHKKTSILCAENNLPEHRKTTALQNEM